MAADDRGERRETLGRAISALRVEKGMSRSELAEATGISYTDVVEIEDGIAEASSRRIEEIAKALGVAREEIAAPEEEAEEEAPEPRTGGPRSGRGYVVPLMGGEWEAMPGQPERRPGRSPREVHAAEEDRRDLLGDLVLALESLPTEDLRRLLILARDLASRR